MTLYITILVCCFLITGAVSIYFLTSTYCKYLSSKSHKQEIQDLLDKNVAFVTQSLAEEKHDMQDRMNKLQSQLNKLERR